VLWDRIKSDEKQLPLGGIEVEAMRNFART
jgi:hypothetical protein